MIRRQSEYGLGLLDRRRVELDRDPFIVAADHDEFEQVLGAEVALLMRHVGREVDEIS